jgi:hypothetical protein
MTLAGRIGSLQTLPYLAAVAVVAAALADFVVESSSNAGVFGSSFLRNDLSSVAPTLVAGLVLGLLVAWGSLTRKPADSGDWLTAAVAQFTRKPTLLGLVVTFALQLVTLFASESCEQLADAGRLLGGGAWLGGPLLASLAIHALVCVAVTLAFVHVSRGLKATLDSLLDVAVGLALALGTRPTAASSFTVRPSTAQAAPQAPHVRRTRGRAPPRGALLASTAH